MDTETHTDALGLADDTELHKQKKPKKAKESFIICKLLRVSLVIGGFLF